MNKLNKAFIEMDQQMQFTYSFGYFFSISMMVLNTLLVLFFNYIYPTWYVMEYFFTLLWMFIFDVALYTTGWAMLQLLHALLAKQLGKCCYGYWAGLSIIKMVKNLKNCT
jgi:hypothetical protein